jgi:hypothetical protein
MLFLIHYVHIVKIWNQSRINEKYVITFVRTCNHCLKANLMLKAQFENIFYDIFWDFKNIHLNIII